ncbi:MAG: ribonuclease HI [Rickettsiales bacterium TMED254]|nr:ribonuclease HI [Rickettsiales bacterium]RPF76697.1 MAG: ribonuclease HI [Rickettsiales bacterium TMED254]
MLTDSVIEIYSDGSCIGNPGPGGWAAIILEKNKKKEIFGGEKITTNNRMELIAVINALNLINNKSKISIYTDSKYIINGITIWMKNWKKNNWKTGNKKIVKNKDLWNLLDKICGIHQVNWNWVKGHSGHELNERVDYLARSEAEKLK